MSRVRSRFVILTLALGRDSLIGYLGAWISNDFLELVTLPCFFFFGMPIPRVTFLEQKFVDGFESIIVA